MEKTKDYIKIADAIHDIQLQLRNNQYIESLNQLSSVANQLKELAEEGRKLGICISRRWFNAANQCHSRIDRLLSDVSYSVSRVKQLVDRPNKSMPKASVIIGELHQLQQEFSEVEFNRNDKNVSVTIEPVTLDSVYLGPFKIQLDLSKLAELYKESPYFVIALDPHPAATSDDVTHPHVSNARLCEGDGYTAIRAALEQGRLTDFFTMVKGILNTYNPDSPYVSLDDWDGIACYECGYVMDRENCYYCSFCERDFCEECSSYCRSCDETLCSGCDCRCQICDEPVCKSCIRSCSDCGVSCCESCLDDNLCPDCKALEDQDNEKENQSEITGGNENNAEKQAEPADETNPAVQPDGMGQADILQGQN